MKCNSMVLAGTLASSLLFGVTSANGEAVRPPVPVIHCTDLFHPHDDFDDVLDLMALYGLHCAGEIELLTVILDQPEKQVHRPGNVLVERLNAVTGQRIPTGTGYEALVDALRSAAEPAVVTVVGSLSDLHEAWSREPGLCRAKIRSVWVFAGDAQEDPPRRHPGARDRLAAGLEYNVALNPDAFIQVMRSGLPIVWIPCYAGGLVHRHQDGLDKVHGSYHMVQYSRLLAHATPEVRNFFLTALSSERPEGGRYEWETVKLHWKSVFGVGIFRAIPRPEDEYPFTFIDEKITVHHSGAIARGAGRPIRLFQRTDRERFYERMSNLTAELIGSIRPPSDAMLPGSP